MEISELKETIVQSEAVLVEKINNFFCGGIKVDKIFVSKVDGSKVHMHAIVKRQNNETCNVNATFWAVGCGISSLDTITFIL